MGIDPEFSRLFGIPLNVDRSTIITGELLFRKGSETPKGDETDRTLYTMIGLAAVPKDFNIEEHVLYPLTGVQERNIFRDLTIRLALDEAIVPELSLNGLSVSGLLRAPMWRV